MERQFNLIKTGTPEMEKRIFPRFPFSFLIFKGLENGGEKIFEVKDISYTGMQIFLRNGGHRFKEEDVIKGILNWRGLTLELEGKVKWVSGPKIGVAFLNNKTLEKNLQDFLSIDNIIDGMKPLHESHFGIELPANLKYWLRSDGPVEIFVWKHNSGVILKFQILLLKDFVEWEDGHGVKTGFVLTGRNVDTPLLTEDEFTFEIDEFPSEKKIHFAHSILEKIPSSFLPEDVLEFLKLKIRGS